MTNDRSRPQRLYFIDAVRVAALAILIVYHSGLIFAEKSSYHITNRERSALLDHLLFFFHEWRLALLFFGLRIRAARRGRFCTRAFAPIVDPVVVRRGGGCSPAGVRGAFAQRF
jgi:hypothetical protein